MSDRYFVSYEVDDVRSVHHWCVFDRQRSNHDYWDSVCMSLEEADAQNVCDSLNSTEKTSQGVAEGQGDRFKDAYRGKGYIVWDDHLGWQRLIDQLPTTQQVNKKGGIR